MIQNTRYKIQNTKRGFTLIELIVVIAIIGILSATIVVNFGKNEDRDVRMESDHLMAYLREVQNKALTGDRQGIEAGTAKVCGYGVSQQGDSAIQTYYIGASLNADCNATDSHHIIDAFYLQNGVKISGSFSDLFFFAPYGNVYSAGYPLLGTTYISLQKGSVVLSDIVHIDASGRIY